MKVLKPILFITTLLLINCGSDDTTLPNEAPDNFKLISPNDNAIDEHLEDSSFTWNTTTDPEGEPITYTLFLDTNPNPTTVMASNISSPNYTLDKRLSLNQTYYWKVEASDGVITTESDIYSFSTRGLNTQRPLVSNLSIGLTRNDAVVFNNQVWQISGYSGLNTVPVSFHSSNGEFWRSENLPFNLLGHTSVVFDGYIWVIGGRDNLGVFTNATWASNDGIHWGFLPIDVLGNRFLHASVVFNNQIWVVGGVDNDGFYKNDVLYGNGNTWTEATSTAPFSKRFGHKLLVFDDKMWLIGGEDDFFESKNDVWYSTDGLTWRLATEHAAFSPRFSHEAVVYDNKIWVLGGITDGGSSYLNDIWYSEDGINWIQESASASFSPRAYHNAVVFQDHLWIISGSKGAEIFSDVYSYN